MIIIINDNEMSIAPNEGGLYKNLAELRNTNGQAVNNVFKAIGFDYYYVEDGNNVEALISAFEKVKDTNRPTVVHIHTLKGKGYEPAVLDKETYHWHIPGFLDKKAGDTVVESESYNSITKDFLLKKKQSGEPVIAITAATPGVFEFNPAFREKMGKNYTDVGIAEEHAIAYASGLAKNGAKPVLCLMSSFVQRTYDQMSQDLALNNSPATVLIYWGGISGADMTHLCTFDIPLISNIPNIVYLAPTSKEEYLAMLEWSYSQNEHPVFIRVPATELVSTGIADNTDYSKLNKYKLVKKGEKAAIIAAGTFFALGEQVKQELKTKTGIDATLINPCYLTGVDEELLNELKKDHSLVITLEDGELDGGFGEKVTRFYGNSCMKVLNFGAKKEFTDRVPLEELYNRYYRPQGYTFVDVKKSIAVGRENGLYICLNLLYFPGITDTEDELLALSELVGRHGVSMIQWRNLNIDPEYYLDLMKGYAQGPSMGLRSFMLPLPSSCPFISFSIPQPPGSKKPKLPEIRKKRPSVSVGFS